ncbi:DUF3429 domain-containing protein [Georhizobium profundi]|uniref:DUF3429 domain-containing protein n=1 Tax=Georhizobium profundi TaxID=2341112 RepID=A0A3Q8XR16_9HYPH|nr:DUF3429 domain-containing protein [Georhizobium profundi]AZN73029.1 DUF3429 domain-containing protein [Georhizobium profundi]
MQTGSANPPLHDSQTRLIAVGLTAAGGLPYAGGLLDVLIGDSAWLMTVQIYGAVIASFVSGIHWGAALFASPRMAPSLLVASNVTALLAWIGALVAPQLGFILLAAVFITLLLIDRLLYRDGILPPWFFRLRVAITAAVATACILLGVTA